DRNDVLGLLMGAHHEDGTPLTEDEILGELGTIVLAGLKNAATALAWAVYELSRHPASLKRLRDELDALGPDPDPDTIAKQPYLAAVCDETLRQHTVHTVLGRV